jgi:hypothetical protein
VAAISSSVTIEEFDAHAASVAVMRYDDCTHESSS